MSPVARAPRRRPRKAASAASRRPAATGPYKPISDYGVIGDLHTVALVGIDGSLDWLCYPRFDSPSVFAALLDHRRGGRFRISSAQRLSQRQLYFPDTNVLITRFLGPTGVGEITDFMPVEEEAKEGATHRIVRRAAAVRGTVAFDLLCRPAFDYARARHSVDVRTGGAVFRTADLVLGLATRIPLARDRDAVRARFDLQQGQTASFVLGGLPAAADPASLLLGEGEAEGLQASTVNYWRRWLAQCNYRGRWRETVHRSALVLKLLTYRPTGAIIAAPTTSLPEEIGGARNWDYRYTWIRDAALTLYALLRIGFMGEAQAFMAWLLDRIRELEPGRPLRPVYRVDGSAVPKEASLRRLEGYRRSRPVRVGNAAVGQLQLDIFGAMMDAVHLFGRYEQTISPELWSSLRRTLGWLCAHWDTPDSGIWEVRTAGDAFVHSKVMCWVALDRGIDLAEARHFPADLELWRETRDRIRALVLARGWNENRKSFVQTYGGSALDASALLWPLVGFLPATDPRMLGTLDAIQRELTSDHLVRRYSGGARQDGLPGEEGTFSLCTFWLVEALTRAGRLEAARLTFEKMLGYANRLGLYSEEIGTTGEALGNFPQAFTHLALISAALNLDRALEAKA